MSPSFSPNTSLNHAYLSTPGKSPVSLRKCPWSNVFLHFSIFLSFICFFMTSGVPSSVLLLSTFLAPIIRLSLLSLTYLSNPTITIFTASVTLIRPLLPYFLGRYILSIPLFGCNALCIVINLLTCLPNTSGCPCVQSMKPAAYLNNEIVHVFITVIKLLSPFNWFSKTFLTLHKYCVFTIFFISLYLN